MQKDKMSLSIIIPTYHRANDLEECLNSIILQKKLPNEVVIVDDSTDDSIEKVVKRKFDKFTNKGIMLKYKKIKEKSSARARNIGINNATGDIILFLDTDVILCRNYIYEILKVYNKYPDALGVQGYIINNKPIKILNILRKITFHYHFEKNKCRVLASTAVVYPFPLTKIIRCQWLSGSNQSFKRTILTEFKYDEKLERYSYKEDVDISYRIYKKYPKSLYITPHAKLIHKISKEGRMSSETLQYMKKIYTLYFFYKNLDNSIVNKLIIFWSLMSELIIYILINIISKYNSISSLKIIKIYIYCLINLKKLKEKNLDFFKL